jgi:hypothetical protein
MRQFTWLFPFLILVGGCNQKTPSQNWPANLQAIQNFTPDQKTQVLNAIGELNQGLGLTAVDTSGQGAGYPITISLVPAFSGAPLQAGLTYPGPNQCLVSIADIVFAAGHLGTLTTVVIHEIGHCIGLLHILLPTNHEIMSPTAQPISSYDDTTIDRFFTSFLDQGRL